MIVIEILFALAVVGAIIYVPASWIVHRLRRKEIDLGRDDIRRGY